jgi:hypothetical protein
MFILNFHKSQLVVCFIICIGTKFPETTEEFGTSSDLGHNTDCSEIFCGFPQSV